MNNLNLRVYDAVSLIGFLVLPALFSTELSRLVSQNGSAAWLAVLAACLVMLCLFLIVIPLMRKYNGRNIIEITSLVLGKPLGMLYGILLGAYFCYFTGIHIRESTEIIKEYGFTLTPIYIVAGLILLTALIMNLLGGRAIVKSAGFFFIIIVLGIAFVMLIGLNRYNPDKLVPALGHGPRAIAKNGLLTASVFDCVIILCLLAPSFSNVGKMKKAGLISIALSAAAYALLCLCYIMMFSPATASNMLSGFIEIGKSSYYNHFFYRFEGILLFFLVFSAAMLAAISLYIARESVLCAFKSKREPLIIIACAILSLAAALVPANILELTEKYLPVIRCCSVVFIAGVPLLIFIIDTIKGISRHEKT